LWAAEVVFAVASPELLTDGADPADAPFVVAAAEWLGDPLAESAAPVSAHATP
jgi:hypothetical protein